MIQGTDMTNIQELISAAGPNDVIEFVRITKASGEVISFPPVIVSEAVTGKAEIAIDPELNPVQKAVLAVITDGVFYSPDIRARVLKRLKRASINKIAWALVELQNQNLKRKGGNGNGLIVKIEDGWYRLRSTN